MPIKYFVKSTQLSYSTKSYILLLRSTFKYLLEKGGRQDIDNVKTKLKLPVGTVVMAHYIPHGFAEDIKWAKGLS